MTVRLTIDETAWQAHVRATLERAGSGCVDITAVVKGNGYGLGRVPLALEAARHLRHLAVGTVHELDVLDPLTAAAAAGKISNVGSVTVLTPALQVPADLPRDVIPTVGHLAHVEALAEVGWRGRVRMKLRSSMQRYGADRDGLSDLVAAARARQLDPVGYLLHPPLRGTGGDAVALEQVEAWLPALDPALPVSISHLTTGAIEQLAVDHPEHRFELRLGTALWHGDKSALHLAADVLDVHAVTPGSSVGYHGVRVVDGGIIAMIGAGSAHGIAPLPDGRSPFHHRRRRLALLEAPHMHTSMVLVDRDVEPPQIGDWVDVQRPLISTWADQVVHR